MSVFNISNVDVKLLSIFCAVYEEGSVSGAALRLNHSQPLISHALDRLRLAFKDPLFVRAGRSITPTERAREIAPEISEIVEKLRDLAEPGALNLNAVDVRFCLSANDFERQLIAPQVLSTLLKQAPGATLRLMNTKEAYAEQLRAREYDVVVSPLPPPDHLDIHSTHLFDESTICFFDSAKLSAEEVEANYQNLDHAEVDFGTAKSRILEPALQKHGVRRNIRLSAPSFEALPSLLFGTRLVATLPSRLQHSLLFADFGRAPLPFTVPTLSFNMIWHKATHLSPAHRWFRSVVKASAPD